LKYLVEMKKKMLDRPLNNTFNVKQFSVFILKERKEQYCSRFITSTIRFIVNNSSKKLGIPLNMSQSRSIINITKASKERERGPEFLAILKPGLHEFILM